MHDEDEDDDEYAPDNRTVEKDLSATDLRGVIKGIIANDANGSKA